MADKQYRFYQQRGQMKWYLESNCKTYTPHRDQAGVFTERDWQLWGKLDFDREVVGQDKAPELPGMEAV